MAIPVRVALVLVLATGVLAFPEAASAAECTTAAATGQHVYTSEAFDAVARLVRPCGDPATVDGEVFVTRKDLVTGESVTGAFLLVDIPCESGVCEAPPAGIEHPAPERARYSVQTFWSWGRWHAHGERRFDCRTGGGITACRRRA